MIVSIVKNGCKYLFAAMFMTLIILGALMIYPSSTNALSGSDFKAGNVIDDGVFYYPGTMTVAEIQNFLEDMLDNPTQRPDGVKGSCDTDGSEPSEFGGGTRAEYAASNPTDSVHNPPYICLTQYYENTTTKVNNLRGRPIPAGAKSAAQIIYDVAQSQKINPRVLIVLLQKEQILVTDDWPVEIQFRSATGYGCPDTAACDSQYYGFYNQVYRAAYQFNLYRLYPGSYTHRAGVNNNVLYSPAACGASSVFIENQATAGLYNYTPYQPNQAALNNLYGLGDSCSSYGNRNFWRLFNDWFGSTKTNTPYAWFVESEEAYVDASRTQAYTKEVLNIAPGEKIYIRLSARNVGNQTWDQSVLRLGTYEPRDRTSLFEDSSWVTNTRPTQMLEASVLPGDTATFEFVLSAPVETGTFRESYNLLAEGVQWMASQDYSYEINVTNPITEKDTNYILQADESIASGERLLSKDTKSTLSLESNGNLVLRTGYEIAWTSKTSGSGGDRLVMQEDGNLVLYNESWVPKWHTKTNGSPGAYLVLQTDGNMVVYSSGDSPIWNSSSVHRPSLLNQVDTRIESTILYIGQSIETANREYKLTLQGDGNLVLYSPNRAIWATYKTIGKNVAFLAMQPDGNLVIYDTLGKPLWYTRTNGRGLSSLNIQTDGNLVIYDSNGNPTWHTRTNGIE